LAIVDSKPAEKQQPAKLISKNFILKTIEASFSPVLISTHKWDAGDRGHGVVNIRIYIAYQLI
jgi:hypothetical protein